MTRRRVFERYLTQAEERALMRHVAQYADLLAQRDVQWMILLRQTGLRVGTLAQLTVGDALEILETGRVLVANEIAKGGRGYELPLNKAARTALRKLLDIRREQGHRAVPSEPLLMSRKRRGLSVRSLQARMQGWVRDARLPVGASPHWLRHTLAKRLMERSESSDPQAIVQIVLGHRHRQTTAIYTLPDRAQVSAAMDLAQ